MGKRLVVFNPSFVEDDRHGKLYSNGVNIFKGVSDGNHGHFEISL